MKRALILLCFAALALAQQQTLEFTAPPPPQVSSVTAQPSQSGLGFNCWWVVAVYPIGKAYPSPPSCAGNVGGTVTVTWAPVPGATSYDVLRTTSPSLPSGPASIAVATGITGNSQSDTLGALSSYTIAGAAGAKAKISLDNINYSTPRLLHDTPENFTGTVTIGTTVLNPTTGIQGPIIACAAAPGDTTGPYASLCIVPATGALWACVNASGCTLAGDWAAAGGGGGGGGSGTVTSVGLVGTPRQITVTGTSPIVGAGSWTLTLPVNLLFPGNVTFAAGTTSAPSFNMPSGVAPTSPTSGDFWNESGVVKFYNGSTRSFMLQDTAVTCAQMPALTGDTTSSAGSCATVNVKLNGVTLSGLATGILKNTTGTGAPSIAVAADFPTLNQNTTGSAANVPWSGLTAPSTTLSLSMGANPTTFTYNAATGAINGLKLTDTLNNTGSGILHYITTASGSTMIPWQADANGLGWKVDTDGGFKGVGGGSGSIDFTTAYTFSGLGAPSNGRVLYCSDCKATSAVDNTCLGSGTGAFAARLAGTWKCLSASIAIAAGNLPATALSTGTSVSLSAPRQYYVCTSTCTVTPPVPAAGYEFCVRTTNNVAAVITFAALGSSAMYEKTDRTAYGTAGTGTMVSGGAIGDQMCVVGLDSTHYQVWSFGGTWTVN